MKCGAKELVISIENPFKNYWKSYCIFKHTSPNEMWPIAYIRKSKYATQEEFEIVLKAIRDGIPKVNERETNE